MDAHDSTVGPSGPAGDPEPGEPADGELEQVLAEYLLAREAGTAPDPEAFVAQHLGKTPAAVVGLLQRGLKALRERLEEQQRQGEL